MTQECRIFCGLVMILVVIRCMGVFRCMGVVKCLWSADEERNYEAKRAKQ
jgi:hypothetical protein